jgi:uncharacterized SAM-binding protein YcdF (DUF218 family)
MADWGMYKPIAAALLMPPVPFLLLVLLGARLILPRRGLGYVVLLMGVLGLWMSSCQVTAVWLLKAALRPPAALLGPEQARLTQAGQLHAQRAALVQRARHGEGAGPQAVPPAAIIVLGSGRYRLVPEYGMSDLTANSAMRLRYGTWLARQTGLPLGFSGGVGWVQQSTDVAAAEADVAARVAEQQFGVRMRWIENTSTDTRSNAARTVAMLADQGVREVVVVTDAFHMPRALRAFKAAAQHEVALNPRLPLLTVTPAPMGFWRGGDRAALDWLPSGDGMINVRLAVHELVGQVAGL